MVAEEFFVNYYKGTGTEVKKAFFKVSYFYKTIQSNGLNFLLLLPFDRGYGAWYGFLLFLGHTRNVTVPTVTFLFLDRRTNWSVTP
jgi:hypothetical protein